MLAKTLGMVLFQTTLSRNNKFVRTNRLFHFFVAANYKTDNMLLFQQSRLTERVINDTQLQMRQFYFSGLLRRIDSHCGSKATKVSNYSRYIEGKIHFCLLFPFSYEEILYEPY